MNQNNIPVFLDAYLDTIERTSVKDGYLDPNKPLSEINPPSNMEVLGRRNKNGIYPAKKQLVKNVDPKKRKKKRTLQKKGRKQNRK